MALRVLSRNSIETERSGAGKERISLATKVNKTTLKRTVAKDVAGVAETLKERLARYYLICTPASKNSGAKMSYRINFDRIVKNAKKPLRPASKSGTDTDGSLA